MVHIFGAVRLGRHVWCGRHGVMMKEKVESSGLEVDGGCNNKADFQGRENRETGKQVLYFNSITSSQVSKCSAAENERLSTGRIKAGKSEYQSDSYNKVSSW